MRGPAGGEGMEGLYVEMPSDQ